MKRFTIIFFSFLIPLRIILSQTVSVDGNAYLEGQTNHENIMILFTRTAPTALTDTAYTDTNGYFNKTVQTGIYNVTYSKTGYLTITLIDVNLYSNYTFTDTTLLNGIELSGQLSGSINPGFYYVTDDIEVATGNSLTIESGVTMFFYQDVAFNINGLLIAEGNKTDSIKFTRVNNSISWGGIKFNNSADDNSALSFCIIEYSNNTGITCNHSSPTIAYSLITNNTGGYGGGFQFEECSPTILNTIVKNNFADDGAGIMSYSASPVIINSNFSNNLTDQYGSGGAFCSHDSNPVITNSSFMNNSANYGGGIYCHGAASPILVNCIFFNNNNYSIYNSANLPCNPELMYSNFWDNNPENFFNCDDWLGVNVTVNTNGDSIDPYNNIQLDPMFVDITNGDFHLQTTSPCIDAGINDSVTVNYDFEDNIRIWDGNGDGDTIVDMGVYEFAAPIYTDLNNFPQEYGEIFYEIYPNPSIGLINIKTKTFRTNLFIKIFDVNGRIIDFINIKNKNKQLHKINLSDYHKGIYFVTLITENNIEVKKIIIN